MTTFLFAGLVLGLSAGFSPGPLFTLVISQTLTYGSKEGLKVALTPLITDLPIIIITTFLLSQLTNSQNILGILSIIGGLFVLYLACENFRTNKIDITITPVEPQSLTKGVLVNALNPHPYLFWIAIGTPTLLKARAESLLATILFVIGFYVCLVGAKVFLVILSGKAKQWLLGKTYQYLMYILGILLLIFAGFLFKDGVALLGFSANFTD